MLSLSSKHADFYRPESAESSELDNDRLCKLRMRRREGVGGTSVALPIAPGIVEPTTDRVTFPLLAQGLFAQGSQYLHKK